MTIVNSAALFLNLEVDFKDIKALLVTVTGIFDFHRRHQVFTGKFAGCKPETFLCPLET